MKTVRIFLASSAELDDEKEQVELFISRKNKDYHQKKIFLELSTWKDFISAMSEVHSQEKYNKYIRSCDIAIFLFHTKLGRFTKEEFDIAYQSFLKSKSRSKRPMIYTFFKSVSDEPFEITDFKNYIDSQGHFYDTYNLADDLFVKLNFQLDKLENQSMIKAEVVDFQSAIKYALYFILFPLLVLSCALLIYHYYQPVDLTVRIKEINTNPELAFEQGEISLTYGNKMETHFVNDEIVFKQIPSKYKHSRLRLKFSSKGFEPIDTLIAVSEMVELIVKRDNSLGLIYGYVRDENNKPIKNVVIQVKDIHTLTDSSGGFRMDIPLKMQLHEQRLLAYKRGYRLWDFSGTPSQTIAWKIILNSD